MASATSTSKPTTTKVALAAGPDDFLFETVVGSEVVSALAKAEQLIGAAQQLTCRAVDEEAALDYIALGGIDFLLESAQALVLASLRGMKEMQHEIQQDCSNARVTQALTPRATALASATRN